MMMKLLKRLPADKCVFCGMDGVLACGLMYGAHGGIGTVYNIVPSKVVQIARAVGTGDLHGALAAQAEIVDVCERYKRPHGQ
jgi:N-acetylneuraminate lyase